MDPVSKILPIKSKYYLLCDAEIMMYGSKKEGLDYFNSLPKPMTMMLVRVGSEKEIRRK